MISMEPYICIYIVCMYIVCMYVVSNTLVLMYSTIGSGRFPLRGGNSPSPSNNAIFNPLTRIRRYKGVIL